MINKDPIEPSKIDWMKVVEWGFHFTITVSRDITLLDIQGKNVLVFEINEYPVKPIAYKNRYYKRVRNSNHMLSLEEIVDLQQQSLNISYDAYPLKESLKSLERPLMEMFVDKANATGRVNLRDDLLTNFTKMKIIQNGKPTLAALLLFGNHGYSIHIGRVKAADTIIDDLLLKAPLITALDEAMVFIKKHINLSYDFDGSLQRKERWQYPLEALREEVQIDDVGQIALGLNDAFRGDLSPFMTVRFPNPTRSWLVTR